MASIYVHIPLCKKACIYCDFYFSTTWKDIPLLRSSLCKELTLRVTEIGAETIDSIYFGGGTPSILPVHELAEILSTIYTHYSVSANAEISLEANPDDLSLAFLKELKALGFNRLSIGLQSFIDSELLFMNRSHTASDCQAVLSNALAAGFDQLSCDLIFGLPNQRLDDCKFNLQKLLKFSPAHISCYSLTIEKNTKLAHMIAHSQIIALEDNIQKEMYLHTISKLEEHGYEHYEISNFAQDGKYSVHNSSYWQGKKYLGIGPSAHSFDMDSRSWNVSSIAKYIDGLKRGERMFEAESLSRKDKINEQIMTSLRTKWGLNPAKLSDVTAIEFAQLAKDMDEAKTLGFLHKKDETFYLTLEGKCIADRVLSDLFVI